MPKLGRTSYRAARQGIYHTTKFPLDALAYHVQLLRYIGHLAPSETFCDWPLRVENEGGPAKGCVALVCWQAAIGGLLVKLFCDGRI